MTVSAPPRPDSIARLTGLTRVLIERNLRVRYRGSALGVYWSMANPLLMTLLYAALFGTAFAADYGGSVIGYVLACFVGVSVATLFANATAQSLVSVVGNGPILNKIKIPPFIFPMSMVAASGFQFIVGTLPVLALICAWQTHNVVNVLALVVPTVALFAAAMGFGLILSALFVFFRDMQYLYEFVLTVLWLTSPIFYPIRLVPSIVRPFIVVLNPLVSIMGSFRQIILSRALPDLMLMGEALLVGGVVLAVGVFAFRYTQAEFMDLI